MSIQYAKIDAASSGDNVIVAAVSGYSIVVSGYLFVCGGTVNVTWRSDTTALSGAMPFVANGGAAAAVTQPTSEAEAGWLQTASGAALNLNLSSAVPVSGHVSYFLRPR